MPLSEKKKNKLDKICESNDDKKIIASLKKEIESDTLTAKDVFSYTAYYYEENTKKRYALSKEVINQFGVFIGKYDPVIKIKFYQLAAERGSSYGNENYAKCLLWKEKYAEALPFARKAVELTNTSITERQQHKFTLWKLLIANKQYNGSADILKSYVESLSLGDVEKLYQTCISDLKNKLAGFINDSDDNTDVPTVRYINQLIYLINNSQHLRKNWNTFYKLKQDLLFLLGQYAEKLDNPEMAWRSYCDIYDKTSPVYSAAIDAKVRLLKSKVRTLLISVPDVAQIELSEGEESGDELEEDLFSPAQLMEAWRKESAWFDSVNKAKIEEKYQQRLETIEEKRKEVNDDESEIDKLDLIEESITKHLPENRKMHRRYSAERHFFDPQRTKKQEELIALTNSIIEQRYHLTTNSALDPINLTGKSSRLFITAERIYQEAVIALNGKYAPHLGIPITREKPWNFNDYKGTTDYGPVEKYQVGNSVTESEHRTSPKKRDRLGDSFLRKYGAYSKDIYPFLNKLCSKEMDKEKQLATWMIRYGKKHQSVSIAELQTIYPTATQADVDSFNHICFLLMEKEQMQWHSAVESKYLLGMSVAQARALILIEKGHLCFEEAFKNEVFFGVYSQKELLDHPERVKVACEHIEEMYTAYLQTKYASQHLAFFKRNLINKVISEPVLTREQAHQDLKAVYGGDSDTDNEGYESDLSFS